jgi:3-oxoadipate enol-lactonase
MKEILIGTNLGRVCVAVDEGKVAPPVVYLHGIFLDKGLWTNVCAPAEGRKQIFVDMPAHGGSENVGFDWRLDDCVAMLLRILDELEVKRCVAVGHSWGSMTALRAAVQYPDRFEALALFNMPFRRTSGLRRLGFILQKSMAAFPKFYGAQAAKALYSKGLMERRPELAAQMTEGLSKRSRVEIARIIEAVILQPEDSSALIRELRVPALAIVGQTDYVGMPPKIGVVTVPGGHISPHEAEEDTRDAIKRVLEMASSSA